MSPEALVMVLTDLRQSYNDSHEQWSGYCDDVLKGFDHVEPWNRKGEQEGTNKKRMYFFIKKEIDFQNWIDFSQFLRERGLCLNDMY